MIVGLLPLIALIIPWQNVTIGKLNAMIVVCENIIRGSLTVADICTKRKKMP